MYSTRANIASAEKSAGTRPAQQEVTFEGNEKPSKTGSSELYRSKRGKGRNNNIEESRLSASNAPDLSSSKLSHAANDDILATISESPSASGHPRISTNKRQTSRSAPTYTPPPPHSLTKSEPVTAYSVLHQAVSQPASSPAQPYFNNDRRGTLSPTPVYTFTSPTSTALAQGASNPSLRSHTRVYQTVENARIRQEFETKQLQEAAKIQGNHDKDMEAVMQRTSFMQDLSNSYLKGEDVYNEEISDSNSSEAVLSGGLSPSLDEAHQIFSNNLSAPPLLRPATNVADDSGTDSEPIRGPPTRSSRLRARALASKAVDHLFNVELSDIEGHGGSSASAPADTGEEVSSYEAQAESGVADAEEQAESDIVSAERKAGSVVPDGEAKAESATTNGEETADSGNVSGVGGTGSGVIDEAEEDYSSMDDDKADAMKNVHLVKVLEDNYKGSKVGDSDTEDETKAHCWCRRPLNFGNVVKCEHCRNWYHESCVERPYKSQKVGVCDFCYELYKRTEILKFVREYNEDKYEQPASATTRSRSMRPAAATTVQPQVTQTQPSTTSRHSTRAISSKTTPSHALSMPELPASKRHKAEEIAPASTTVRRSTTAVPSKTTTSHALSPPEQPAKKRRKVAKAAPVYRKSFGAVATAKAYAKRVKMSRRALRTSVAIVAGGRLSTSDRVGVMESDADEESNGEDCHSSSDDDDNADFFN